MGRKRKTRWRRLSIGETSANEEEDAEDSTIGGSAVQGMLDNLDSDARILSGKLVGGMNVGRLTKSLSLNGDTSSPISSFNNMLNGTNSSSSTSSINSQHHQNNYSASTNGPPPHHHSQPYPPKGPPYNNPRPNYNGHQHHHSHHQSHHHHQNGHYNGGRSHYNNHYANSTPNPNGDSSKDSWTGHSAQPHPPPTGNNQQNGHHVTNGGAPPSNYYNNGGGRHHYHSNGPRPHYNSGATTPPANNPTSNGHTSTDPNQPPTTQHNHNTYSSRNSSYHYNNHHNGGSRFRKPRPYGSYYHSNTTNSQDGTNRPSYNQDEYTKITTPRQDVLFKKGYLTQKKTPASSGGDSGNSTTTTPTASTNGTPDTQSTNGVHSDYSEGYENGETDCGIPYDDTIYYGSIPEAVFTDPHTGQLYYGHCSPGGEYYDAYPMMLAGYPPPLYYHMPYQAVDWNGMPTGPMYPVIAPIPVEEHLTYKAVESLDASATSPVDPPGSESSEGGSCSSGEGSERSVNDVGENKSGDKKVEDDESTTPPQESSPAPAPDSANDSGKAPSGRGGEQKEGSEEAEGENIPGKEGGGEKEGRDVLQASSPSSPSPLLEKDKSGESKTEEEERSKGNNSDDGSTSTLESVPAVSPDPASSTTQPSPTLAKSSTGTKAVIEAAKSGGDSKEETGKDGEKSKAALTKAPASSLSSTAPPEKAVPFVPAPVSGALSSTTCPPITTAPTTTTHLPQPWAPHPGGHHHPQALHNGYGVHHGNGVGMPGGPHPGMTIMSGGGHMQAPIPHYHHHPHHPPPHHGGPPPPGMMPGMGGAPGSTFIPVTASNQHPNSHMLPASAYPPQHHLSSVPPPFIYPHPGGFVYGPPIYNGVVVPYGGGAVSSLEYPPHSRKKRKKRRRKKDGQWIDEGTDESDGGITNEDFQYYYNESLNTEEIYPAVPFQTSYHHHQAPPLNSDPNVNEYAREQPPLDPEPVEPNQESDSLAKQASPLELNETETQTEAIRESSVPKVPTYSEQARKATKKTVLNMDAKVFVQKSSVSKPMSTPQPLANPPPSELRVKEAEKGMKVVSESGKTVQEPTRSSNGPNRKSPEEPKWETKRFGRNAKKSSQVISSPTKKPEEPAPYVREPRRWSTELNCYTRVEEPTVVARKQEGSNASAGRPTKTGHASSSSSSKESSPVRAEESGKKFKEVNKAHAKMSKSGGQEPESHETSEASTADPAGSDRGSEQATSSTEATSGTTESTTTGQSVDEPSTSPTATTNDAPDSSADNLTDLPKMSALEGEDRSEAGMRVNSASSSRKSLQKPSDLVMPIPSIDSQGDLSLLALQQSPDSIGNEPSSPDSLNTNQSVAGSEVAVGDTLSMSESELLNRTTSIDEVEEDLPQEAYLDSYNSSVVDLSTLPEGGSSIASTTLQEEHILTAPLPEDQLVETQESVTASVSLTNSHHVPRPTSSETTAPSAPSQNEPDTQDLNQATDVIETGNVKADETLLSQLVNPPSPPADEAVKKPELARTEPPSSPNLPLPRPAIIETLLPPPQGEDHAPQGFGSAEEIKTPVPAHSPADRPKSITLAVSEWLKMQGDDALTPIISYDDNDVTQEEDDDLDGEDDGDDEEEDEDFELSRRTIEETCSKLNGQNQKNVLGNPWAAPSSKLEPGKKRRLFMTLTSRRNPTYGFRVLLQSSKPLLVPTTPSSDGEGSRVAPSSLTGNAIKTGTSAAPQAPPTSLSLGGGAASNGKSKTQQHNSSKAHNYDSGLELSSPENRGNKRRNRSRRARQAHAAATAASSATTHTPPPSPDSSMSSSQDLPTSILSVSAVSKLLSDVGSISILDEEDKSDLLCNPRNFSCYYQLGVVCDDASSSTPDTDVPQPQYVKSSTTLISTETQNPIPNNAESDKTSVQKFYTVSLYEHPTPPEIHPGYKSNQKRHGLTDTTRISSDLQTNNSSNPYTSPLLLSSEHELLPDARRPSIESDGTELSSSSEEIPEYVSPTTEFSSVINQRTAPTNIIRNRFISPPPAAQNALIPSTVCCVIQ